MTELEYALRYANMPPQYCPGYVFTIEEWDGTRGKVTLTECFSSGVTMIYLDDIPDSQGPFGPDWNRYTQHRVSWAYLRSIVCKFHGHYKEN